MDMFKKIEKFNAGVKKLAQFTLTQDAPPGGDTLEARLAKYRTPGILSSHNSVVNLASDIDNFFATHNDPKNLSILTQELNLIPDLKDDTKKAEIFSVSRIIPKLLPTFADSPRGSIPQKSAPAQKATPAPAKKAPVAPPSLLEQVSYASSVVKGIAAALKKPGANRQVLLERLNKYRLIPMAKLFSKIYDKDYSRLDPNTKKLVTNLKNLFSQVDDTFSDEDKNILKQDHQVAQALDNYSFYINDLV